MTYEEFKESVSEIEMIQFQFEDETQTVSMIIDGRVSPFVPYMKIEESIMLALDIMGSLETVCGEKYPPGAWELINEAMFSMLEA